MASALTIGSGGSAGTEGPIIQIGAAIGSGFGQWLRVSPADLRVLILPDHITSVEQRKHVRGLVPYAMWGAGIDARSGLGFAERTAAQTELVCEHGHDLMGAFLRT